MLVGGRPEDPATLGEWMRKLRPDYAGRSRAGVYFCLFTDTHPTTGAVLWAIGYSPESLEKARGYALRHMAEQRFGAEVALLLGD